MTDPHARNMAILNNAESERDFQQKVVDYAHLTGWKVAHFRPAYTEKGWRTPVAADGKGFVDLVLAKVGREVIYAELKTNRGKLTREQGDWKFILSQCPGVEYKIWRPRDWEQIEKILGEGRTT